MSLTADAPAEAPAEVRVPVRVWQVPIRIIHWLLVGSIVVLSVTGFYIGTPILLSDASIPLMAWARAIHLGAAFVFIALIVCRAIFAFTGNRYARWDQWLPLRRERLKTILPTLRFYLFLSKEPPTFVGHNPLAGMTYTVLFGMFTVEVFTGLALQSVHDHDGWMRAVSGWVYALASAGTIRLIHHLIMWFTWGFVIHHIYSATLMDHDERTGVISSIITGWKNIPKGWS